MKKLLLDQFCQMRFSGCLTDVQWKKISEYKEARWFSEVKLRDEFASYNGEIYSYEHENNRPLLNGLTGDDDYGFLKMYLVNSEPFKPG